MAEAWARLGFREAAADLGWRIAERAGRFVLVTAVGLFVARHLGPERLGALSYGVALVTLLGFVPALGLDAILKRALIPSAKQTAELLASSFSARAGWARRGRRWRCQRGLD